MNRRLNRTVAVLALAAASAAGAAGAIAQPAPAGPLRAVLPVGPGSGVDTIIRAMSPSLSKALGGQAVVIENLPGAGGLTGTLALVKAAPDGRTIGVVSNNHVINPSVFKSMPFDSLKDITPISVLGSTPFVLVVNPKKLPVNTLQELVAALKARPGAYNYASSGNGTVLHVADEMFVDLAGVSGTHIPYKGVAPMVTDLIGGQVDWGVVSVPSVQGHLKSGALRAVAVTSAKRTPALPDVPTAVEQGMPGMIVDGWFAVVGPARLPAADVKRIHDAFVQALASPDVQDAMAKQGNVINPTTPDVATSFFRTEQERYAQIVRKANVHVD
jgi:tripartite-type tricarboxylate transporter receptor subunit TctC